MDQQGSTQKQQLPPAVRGDATDAGETAIENAHLRGIASVMCHCCNSVSLVAAMGQSGVPLPVLAGASTHGAAQCWLTET
jgi:hypothetical protein